MFFSWRTCCQIRSKQRNEKPAPGMQPHSNNTDTDCPCTVPQQLCSLCRAHSWRQNRNRSGTNWKPSLCLVCGCVVISSKSIFWMLPSLLSSPRTFALKQVVTIVDAPSSICLPAAGGSLQSLSLTPARERLPSILAAAGTWPLQVILEAWQRVFSLCPSLCPRLGGRKFRQASLALDLLFL